MGEGSDERKYTIPESHRKFAVDLFNNVWTLLERKERTREEEDRMVHAAHASVYHWSEVGTAVNLARGEWQVSRVYAVLRRPRASLDHAERCLDIVRRNGIGDFDLAFAFEAMARAYAVAGKPSESATYLKLAESAGKEIRDKEDRAGFFRELETVPGKGLE